MIEIDPKIHAYAVAHSDPPSAACDAIERFTREGVPGAGMLVGPLEGAFLRFLVRSLQARSILEIGTFTGYSALTMAEALPNGGRLLTLDVNPETTAHAKRFWAASPHGTKIESRLGPALESIANLRETFDLIFVDADKENYPQYLAKAKDLLNPRGVLAFDNALWSGKVVAPEPGDAATQSIAQTARLIKEDPAWHSVLLPIRDGILVAYRAD